MFGINQSLLDIILFVFAISTFHGLYLSAVGIIRSSKDKPKLIFSFIILIFSGIMLAYILVLNKRVLEYPNFFGYILPYLYLLGPLYFFFVSYQAKQTSKFKALNSLHLIPFIYYFWQWLIFANQSFDQKVILINVFYSQTAVIQFADILLSHLPYFHFLIYVLLAQAIIQKKILLQNKLAKMTRALSILILIFIFLPYLMMLLGLNAAIYEIIILLLLAIFIHYCGYQLLFSKNLDLSAKYKNSPLTSEEMSLIKHKINDVMILEKRYLEQDFKISDLSKAIDYPVHHISQVLGETMNTNFSNLINSHRIKELTERLLDEQFAHFSFFAIAQDCGFKNKSNFHRVFKNAVKMTPKEFVEHAKLNN